MVGPQRVVVFGPTGTAGSEVVRQCLADPRIAEVRALTRRPLAVAADKLREVRRADLSDLAAVADTFEGIDGCFFCLGVAQSQAPEETAYRAITVGIALAAARTLLARSPGHTFHFLSGASADPTGRSFMMWARVKGEAENELAALGLARLYVYRPGYIHPERDHARPGVGVAVARALFPLLRKIDMAISAVELARGMIAAQVGEGRGGLLRNREIRTLARA